MLRSKVAVFVELFNRQEALRIGQEELESKIAERTKELASANLALSAEIDERTKIERERVQLLRREQAARLEAERANRLKDEFLATLSHELRTPLNAIMGWSHVLSQSNHDRDTVQRAANVIRQNATSQAQLIDDILDVSRIVGGRLTIESGLVSVKRVIEDAVDSLMPAATAKSIQVIRKLDDTLNVLGDRDRLQQVVWNLVSNAFKFTPKGGSVTIALNELDGDVHHRSGRYRHRHCAGIPAVRVRSFPPGRQLDEPPSQRSRSRHGDCAAPGRAARRHGHGREPREKGRAPPSACSCPGTRARCRRRR